VGVADGRRATGGGKTGKDKKGILSYTQTAVHAMQIAEQTGCGLTTFLSSLTDNKKTGSIDAFAQKKNSASKKI
jgi:hypothetical protein